LFKLKNYKIQNVKNDVLSGTVVAMALVPEAIAFSLIAGVSPQVGLYTAFILGLIASLIGGRAGLISGATGAVAIVLVSLVKVHGLEYLLATTVLAGLIQIAIGVFRGGKFIKLVPQPAMFGFVNGLAVVIASAQFAYFSEDDTIMMIIVIITMFTMYALPKITKILPASLVAILVLSFLVYSFNLETKTVSDLANISGSMPSFHIPDVPFNFETLWIILPYAIIVALVGLIESLLTLSVIDELSQSKGNGNKECIAQGIGNTTCGFFGAMAGCVMIGQSIINFTSGGLGRLSGIIASILLIVFVVKISGLIGFIPIGVLVGIMFMVSISTFEWSSFHRFKHMSKIDIFVMLTTTIITIYADLAMAVITGVIISALAFAWKHASIFSRTHIEKDGSKIYDFDGVLFFASTTDFHQSFDFKNDPQKVVLDFKDARVMDSSGAKAIDLVTKTYKKMNKALVIRHLSEDCRRLLKFSGPYCEFQEDDPTYQVLED
jgi:SulP family sulfate permease